MKEKILVVDDISVNRDMLEEMLKEDYEIEQAEGGMQALRILKDRQDEFVAILLDLMMPEVDGFAVLEVMRQQKWSDSTPVIVISGENSRETEKRSLSLGAADFIRKPFDQYVVRQRVKNIADLFSYRRSLESKVKKQTETLRKQYRILQLQAEKIRERNVKIIDILGTVVECRNLESGEHIKRVKGFTGILAKELMKAYPEYELTEEKIGLIATASALHDIGKIAIPDHILLKPAKLTDDEYDYMKSHAARGAEILQQIEEVWDGEFGKICYDICRHHHERYDGRGYPDALRGDDIPIAAQLVSVADVYDALVSERVYKEAYSPEKAFHMIVSGECGVFSPKLLECFRNVRKDFEKLAAEHA